MNTKKKDLLFFIFDIIIISTSFFYMIYLKPASLRIYLPQYINPFLGFAVIWLLLSLLAGKFKINKYKNLTDLSLSIIRTDFIILTIIIILIYFFKRFDYSRLIVLGTIFLSCSLEIIFVSIYFLRAKNRALFDTSETYEFKAKYVTPHFSTTFESDNLIHKKLNNIKDSIEYKLGLKYLATQYDLFEFLRSQIPLNSIHKKVSLVLDTHTLYNIEVLEHDSQEFFMNLHQINDFRRVNKYFIQVNKNLKMGGYFVGCVQTIQERYNLFFTKFPLPFASIFYGIDSLFRRVFPKLPIFKVIYFAITRGKNRAISKTETLGRLQFCGFKIIAIEELNGKLYFITRKISVPSEDEDPSYSPIVKMKRSGKEGREIFVYKFRTMHPYSEYLQSYMIESYGYGKKGKVDDDFRVTAWGKWMRRFWLDEIPQLLNWLQGDLSLVGVRPLSANFLAEYPEELKKERFKYKPGCIPPYVALRMQAVDDYIESERIYLAEKKKHPIWTDIKYFWWAVFNILTNRIRSE